MGAPSRQGRLPDWAYRLLPFLSWAHRVNRRTLRDDLLAGLTGAIVVLPQGVAFATIAGMPPEYGLYAGMVPAIVAALFGSSWHLVSGPTTAASVVLYSSLSALADPGTAQYVTLALTLTVMVGVTQLIMGFARLGALVNFISHSVVVGFTAGAAVLIAAKQIRHFFGLSIPRGSEIYEIVAHLFTQPQDINLFVLAVGASTLLTGVAIKRFAPRFPYMIGAMLVGSLAAVGLDHVFGTERTLIATVGALPSHLPPLSLPDFSPATLKQLAPAAMAVTLFALTEAVSIARSLALRAGQHIDGNQEFIGQGLSNVAGSFFSGYVATGSFNRSGLNYEAGAKTPLAAVFAGSLLTVVVLLVAPSAAYLPNAAMAGILFLIAWGLVDTHHIRKIVRASGSEAAVMAATFFSALFIGMEFAIFLGVFLSLLLYLRRTSRPEVRVRAPDPSLPKRRLNTDPDLAECPQLKLVRVDGSLFYGATGHIIEQLRDLERAHPEQRHLAIIATGINFIDVAGAELLAQEAARRRTRGGGLYLLGPKAQVRKFLAHGGYLEEIGADNLFPTKTAGLHEIQQRLDRDRCRHCPRAVFLECPGA
ncbi:MAG: SulP family inorganic anion transporter, partial [Gammaproteobacteria bacterium]|nr:SulP family inorganic anion transporter [Gammaproteobacteria bacterium]NIR98089.1 SulP family inorganic anion transporter [Gammaproteobacteria bacterium]NIT63779.1 SulP family inorganic anion transporter [Gammaproteobacteria bacterium]NIV20730.1 sulfate permease [Gammaproteobacteria bacterium]NIY32359.1 sulfate permease [Gammaproteobacteria bacterium]